MALDLAPVRGLHQDLHFHRPYLPLEHTIVFKFVARAGGPGEVVNVISVITQSLRAVRIADFANLHSAGADNFILRHRQLDVVYSEVGKELSESVILMAIPGSVPPHADFRKPLPAQHEIALPS